MNEKQQFQQWLPFYVNGRLNGSDYAWMNQYLAEHPDAMADVNIERALKLTLHSGLPDFSPKQGLDTFMARIRLETPPLVSTKSTKSNKSILQRCLDSIGSVFLTPQWVMAVGLIIVQTGLIGILLTHRTSPLIATQSEWRSVGNESQFKGPVLQITFKPSTTEEEIRLLLVKIRGTFLGGPGQLGNYIVQVPMDSIEEAQAQVKKSLIVESVEALQEMPVDR